jgi:hypothetical protein
MKNNKWINESDIPVVTSFNEATEENLLAVLVDGFPAKMLITERLWYGTKKVWISFSKKHPRWEYDFGTKYYNFSAPGRMSWGMHGEVMKIEKVV